MLARGFWLAGLLAVSMAADTSSSASDSSSDSSSGSSSDSSTAGVVTLSGSVLMTDYATASYASIGSQITASNLYSTKSSSSTNTASSTDSDSSGSKTTHSSTITSTSKGSTSVVSLLVGGGGIVTETIINGTVTLSSHLNSTTTTSSGTASSTSTAAVATNTQPCNGYPEFCNRKYSNITEVCAHNSAFVKKGNAASNQALGIDDQLDDGIRMIQGETHFVNDTVYSCHTSCDLLNAGTWLSELETVAAWVEDHPYDIVTILIVNSDYINVNNYTAPLQASGLGPYLYEPPYIPMRLDDWPTLSEMILMQKRVVVFMDYNANQQEVPYILDEFTHMWETPFSPTNDSFPCTTQRPPNLNQTLARDGLMYLINHNLNADLSLLGETLLVPNTATLNVTNAAGDQYGMLGAMSDNCTADWGRPPNFLLVDYYNVGNGSVFEVAAAANNVTYTGVCCGVSTSGASDVKSSAIALVVALAAVFVFVV